MRSKRGERADETKLLCWIRVDQSSRVSMSLWILGSDGSGGKQKFRGERVGWEKERGEGIEREIEKKILFQNLSNQFQGFGLPN